VFCGPALLPTIQPRSAVAPQEGHAGERGLDLCHCSLCAWDLALPACAGIYPGGTLHRRAAFRESEQRQGERLLRRGNTGRNPHALIENRRSRVISRTSTQRYKSTPENLPEIAKQLGV